MGLSLTKLAYVPLVPATVKDHIGPSWAKLAYVPLVPAWRFLGLLLDPAGGPREPQRRPQVRQNGLPEVLGPKIDVSALILTQSMQRPGRPKFWIFKDLPGRPGGVPRGIPAGGCYREAPGEAKWPPGGPRAENRRFGFNFDLAYAKTGSAEILDFRWTPREVRRRPQRNTRILVTFNRFWASRVVFWQILNRSGLDSNLQSRFH